MLTTTQFNPDVLSCLANLSSDEVFTPPKLANEMLDLLPEELWSNSQAKFLDPVCKTGVFLREIAKRLLEGLKDEIPDLQKRIDHIFKNQLYGIAITELTALMSRRTLYCSKHASGEKSVVHFHTDDGNILFERIEHTWTNGKCSFCGTSKEQWDKREDLLEKHAYQFIHTENPEKILDMKFDVIIGNPPYQLNDGGGSNGISAKPIYNLFVDQAKKMAPEHLVFVIPARWYAGGKGLDGFRAAMLNDEHIRTLVDFPKSRECFDGVDIAGGVCYFNWEKNYSGPCEVISRTGKNITSRVRKLDEFSIFIRDNVGIDILHKVLARKERMLSEKVLPRNSFGFTTADRGSKSPFDNSITLISSGGIGYVAVQDVKKNISLVDRYKVSVGTLNPDRGGVNNASDGKMNVTTKVKLLEPYEVVTETYIVIDCFEQLDLARNCANYIRTKFARFLISLTLSSMHIVRENFQFVPVQDFTSDWNDERLFKKYGLTDAEMHFIDSVIRPMDTDLF